jgi:hypothetical protein
MAGLLVQHQRLQFVRGGLELAGIGVVDPHGGWAVRVGSMLVDDAGAPSHRWPPCWRALGAPALGDYPYLRMYLSIRIEGWHGDILD